MRHLRNGLHNWWGQQRLWWRTYEHNTSMVGSMGQGSNAVRWSTRQNMHVFDSGRVAPVSDEIVTISASVMVLIHILWGIRGKAELQGTESALTSGAFLDAGYIPNQEWSAHESTRTIRFRLGFDSSRVGPIAQETIPSSIVTSCLLRVSWADTTCCLPPGWPHLPLE